jgi:hypothetical protein
MGRPRGELPRAGAHRRAAQRGHQARPAGRAGLPLRVGLRRQRRRGARPELGRRPHGPRRHARLHRARRRRSVGGHRRLDERHRADRRRGPAHDLLPPRPLLDRRLERAQGVLGAEGPDAADEGGLGGQRRVAVLRFLRAQPQRPAGAPLGARLPAGVPAAPRLLARPVSARGRGHHPGVRVPGRRRRTRARGLQPDPERPPARRSHPPRAGMGAQPRADIARPGLQLLGSEPARRDRPLLPPGHRRRRGSLLRVRVRPELPPDARHRRVAGDVDRRRPGRRPSSRPVGPAGAGSTTASPTTTARTTPRGGRATTSASTSTSAARRRSCAAAGSAATSRSTSRARGTARPARPATATWPT